MVDVVVNDKGMAQAPYDPNDIPPAVRERAAAVDALYKSGTPVATAAEASAAAQDVASPLAPPAAPASPDVALPIPPSQPGEDDNSNTWKSRHLALQGRHDKEIGELNEKLNQMSTELLRVQNERQQRAQQQQRRRAPLPQYLTAQDEENYGRDLLEMSQRAALQVLAPEIQDLKAQNAALRKREAANQRKMLDQQVELMVPDYREIDRNPRWHQWLLGVDTLSGRVRQNLLNEAISAGAAPRVISFFNGFKQEEAATGHMEAGSPAQLAQAPRQPVMSLNSLATPGRARPASGGESSLPPDKPLYTRTQVAQLYAAHQRGAYVGREAEWQRQDLDIIAAGREGRIRN